MKAKKPGVRPSGRLLRFEQLESRQMLSVTLDLSPSIAITPLRDSGGLPINKNVSNQPAVYQSEMTLDVNPANPLHLAGFSGKIVYDPLQPAEDLYYHRDRIDAFQSFDGGVTWMTTTIDDGTFGINDGFGPATLRFDPSVAFDATGNLYIAYGHELQMPAGLHVDNIVVAKWDYANNVFTQFRSVDSENGNGLLDKFHLATGVEPSTGNQAVYVTYLEAEAGTATLPGHLNIMVAGSNDGGANFGAPVQVSDVTSEVRIQNLADPAVGPNGELYVSWNYLGTGTIYFDSDLDGLFASGDDFGIGAQDDDYDVPARQMVHPLLRLGTGINENVNAQPSRGITSIPVLDVDRSVRTWQPEGSNPRLYLTWIEGVGNDYATTGNSDVFLAWSDDKGAHWSEPARVGSEENSAGTDFLPWVDVDQVTGSVNVLYYTTDGDQATGNDDVHVRLATSIDGGSSFAYATMSQQTSKETEGYSGDYLEYIGLAVHGGTAHALWSSRLPVTATHPNEVDLEAVYASASLLSVTGDNVLKIAGDDGNVTTNDTITVTRNTLNTDYVEVRFNNALQYAGLAASVDRIEIDGKNGLDVMAIDANVSADVDILGGDGNDSARLRGNGASSLRSFVFHGNAGDDKLYVDYNYTAGGDPLPMAGFEFNFDGGAGMDDAFVIEPGSVQQKAYFVNTFADAADVVINGRADSSSAPDDQTTLRSAIQEANAAVGKTYIFLPDGTNYLSVSGTDGALQGDLDVSGNVVIVGTGPGMSIIDAGNLANHDRIFDVAGSGVLSAMRTTLALGAAPTTSGLRDGGAVRVQNGGEFNLDYSAVVGNETVRNGDGGAIYFASTGHGSVTNSVITINTADDETGGIYLQAASAPGIGGTVMVTNSIVVNNYDGDWSSTDVFAGTNREFTSGGYNRLGNEARGFVHNQNGDYIKQASTTVAYVVTSVVDSYDGTANLVNLSLRDAISLANATVGTQEIWLPAWKFVLTWERITAKNLPEMNVSEGDIEITESLILRGIGGANGPATGVAWMAGAVEDKAFELVGDYDIDIENGTDRDVDGDDFLLWQRSGTSDLSADGNDDGVVDNEDLIILSLRLGNVLTVESIQCV